MSISAYNTTPGLNTTISGINLAEGCNASGINDAIRQMMADLASALAVPAINSHDNKYASGTGMPTDMTLAGISGATRYSVSVAFHGHLNNTNGAPIVLKITIAVKDGGSTLQSREWSITSPTAYNDWYAFSHRFEVVTPAAGAFTISITDTESDGGIHTWAACNVSASANVIR